MANDLANQKPSSLPSSEERKIHREWIGGRIATLLLHYWREDDSNELNREIGKDWASVLEGLSQDAIVKACIQYMREEARRKPTPGAIYELAKKYMPASTMEPAVAITEQKREPRCTQEAAQKIVKEAGYNFNSISRKTKEK